MPTRAALVACAVVVASTWAIWMEPVVGGIGAALLVRAVAEVLLPTTYTLDVGGLQRASLLERRHQPWSQFAAVRPTADGVWLQGSGRTRLHRARRSCALHCPGQEQEVLRWLQAVVAPAADAPQAVAR